MTDYSLIPITITKEQFDADVSAEVFGTSNPSVMENLVWKWMISTLHSAWSARKSFHPNSGFPDNAGWCFQRFGQTKTTLPDGRVVYIAGEHEDGYDPDFFIYNDVVVFEKALPDKVEDITIYGYPTNVFLPTDNHTSTYVPGYECIYIIGGLGYVDGRHRKEVSVHVLDLGDFSIREVKTKGEVPDAVLSNHRAVLIPGANGETGKIRVTLSQQKDEVFASDSEGEGDLEDESVEIPEQENQPDNEDELKEALENITIGDEEREPEDNEPPEEEEDSDDDYDYDSQTSLEPWQSMQEERMPRETAVDPSLPLPKVYSLDLDTFVWTYDGLHQIPTVESPNPRGIGNGRGRGSGRGRGRGM